MSILSVHTSESRDCRVCKSGGGGGIRSSVCLGGLVAHRSPLVSALVTSGSVLSGLPQSSMPTCIPQFSLLLEPSTVVFRVCCRTVIHGRFVELVTSISLTICHPALLNRDPATPYQRALSLLPEAITQLKLLASSFLLTRLFRH